LKAAGLKTREEKGKKRTGEGGTRRETQRKTRIFLSRDLKQKTAHFAHERDTIKWEGREES